MGTGDNAARPGGRQLSRDVVAVLPPALYPARTVLRGQYADLEPLHPLRHAAELHAAAAGDDASWDYMGYGPFASKAAHTAWLREQAALADPTFYAIRDHVSGTVGGVASYLNIHPLAGVIEIGHIWLGPTLRRSRAATEALSLMLRYAFDELGYRRLEWKCNALNAASRQAALRLGFTFEGIFYQHMIVKGRNRDTAWYSILDHEWPARRAAFDAWLAPENFDSEGRQRQSLSDLRADRAEGGSPNDASPRHA